MNILEEYDLLMFKKNDLLLKVTACINISEQLIARYSKLKKELSIIHNKKITGGQRD